MLKDLEFYLLIASRSASLFFGFVSGWASFRNSFQTSEADMNKHNKVTVVIGGLCNAFAKTSRSTTCILLLSYFCMHCSSDSQYATAQQHPGQQLIKELEYIVPSELPNILYEKCALLCVPPCEQNLQSMLIELRNIFRNDDVFIGLFEEEYSNLAQNGSSIAWKSPSAYKLNREELAFYHQEHKDRACLLLPPNTAFKAEPYEGPISVETLVQFVNEKCGVFRTMNRGLTAAGLFHEHIMQHLYEPKDKVEKCQRIKIPQQTFQFSQQYLFRSRPVIIENATWNWPAMRKWTTEYFRSLYGNREIHIKLTQDGNFEGVESANLWADYHENWIPEQVRTQLQFPNLVVIRPATSEMKFSDFLDYISSANRSHSAYLEYSSIPYYMPQLEDDIMEMPFLDVQLQRKHLNMWLSDGNTLGKLHFDPYDNFLCQISGEKHLTLFDPHHNENLYEAHIPEALLSYDSRTGKFRRITLLESTSMVMSPVDITNPDLKRFPKFAATKRLHCVLKPGDVLFMPSFWWHEVQSYPDPLQKRNLAVNFWYEPLFTKEFPCAECSLKYNMFYRHFLYNLRQS